MGKDQEVGHPASGLSGRSDVHREDPGPRLMNQLQGGGWIVSGTHPEPCAAERKEWSCPIQGKSFLSFSGAQRKAIYQDMEKGGLSTALHQNRLFRLHDF